MEYAICTVPAAPVRKEPSHRSEMTNQLLFGETLQVLEEKDEWFRVKAMYDDYEGWLTWHLITPVDKLIAEKDHRYVTDVLTNPINFSDQLISVPMGSFLAGFDEDTRFLWDQRYEYYGSYQDTASGFDPDLLIRTIDTWLNAPYLWGGKTFMGVDCSGFVQTVYKLLGIKLKRDAYQQAEQGSVVENLSEAEEGDLAFFHNDSGRIIHVGILLEGAQIVHASGKVRIDPIDEMGIENREVGKRTHHLHSIRRVVPE